MAAGTHAERHTHLLEKAGELFALRGYDATSMEDIADAVGLLKGSLYYYVKNKQELLCQIMERTVDELISRAELIGQSPDSNRDKIELLIRNHLRRLDQRYFWVVLTNHYVVTKLPEPVRETMVQAHRKYRDVYRNVITAGIATGEFRADLNVAITVNGLLGMCNWAAMWYKPNGRLTSAEVGEIFAAVALKSLARIHGSSAAGAEVSQPASTWAGESR